MNKKYLKTGLKFGLYGILLGTFLILFMYVVGSTLYGRDFLIYLMYIPIRIYIKFFPCSLDRGDCMFYGLEEMIFASPIYLGFLGFLIGILIEKLRKKK
ncbi:MAG TPA: hypothetical protein VJH20_00055 [Candidatus Nanoarchaeia archaeon]|nr:hypothetical protein [Candidatus Woesearchaeota archaeon]HLC73008.1 hypothetical protein [Candidatus Nanoarchaeia archaeon]